MPSEIEDNVTEFLDASQPPLREEERALYLEGVYRADVVKANALQVWRNRYFDKQPTWAERSATV